MLDNPHRIRSHAQDGGDFGCLDVEAREYCYDLAWIGTILELTKREGDKCIELPIEFCDLFSLHVFLPYQQNRLSLSRLCASQTTIGRLWHTTILYQRRCFKSRMFFPRLGFDGTSLAKASRFTRRATPDSSAGRLAVAHRLNNTRPGKTGRGTLRGGSGDPPRNNMVTLRDDHATRRRTTGSMATQAWPCHPRCEQQPRAASRRFGLEERGEMR